MCCLRVWAICWNVKIEVLISTFGLTFPFQPAPHTWSLFMCFAYCLCNLGIQLEKQWYLYPAWNMYSFIFPCTLSAITITCCPVMLGSMACPICLQTVILLSLWCISPSHRYFGQWPNQQRIFFGIPQWGAAGKIFWLERCIYTVFAQFWGAYLRELLYVTLLLDHMEGDFYCFNIISRQGWLK